MAELIINGPARIKGHVTAGGNKNAALPMIAAAALAHGVVKLHNVPDILDVRNMLAILRSVGASVDFSDDCLIIDAENLTDAIIPDQLFHATRTSFLFAGPLALRFGHVKMGMPGGDMIGRRRLDPHLYGLSKLGIDIQRSCGGFEFKAPARLAGLELFLDEASVTATEHIMMTAALAEGTTVIRNAACEPHVEQLAQMLNKMGADIHNAGSNIITINGVRELQGCDITLESDYVEAVSYMALCAATGGKIEITGQLSPHNYWMARRVFERFNCPFSVTANRICMEAPEELILHPDFNNAIPTISDGPWPQFPSDMMSCFVALATQAQGTVLFFEKMFESRLYFVDKLIMMGANAVVCDPHRVLISGPAALHGIRMISPDIRAGMAMIIAACCASGQSRIENVEMVQRGYHRLLEKLQNIGVDAVMLPGA